MHVQGSAFQSLCEAAKLTVTEAAEYLSLDEAALLQLMNGASVPVHVRNALKTEAMFNLKPVGTVTNFKKRQNAPTCVSLFSGAGGLDIGLEQAGYSTVFANDIERYACESLKQNKMIASMDAAEFEKWFDVVVAKQRCYSKSSKAELDLLKSRLAEGLTRNLRHLASAAIMDLDVRQLTPEQIFQSTGLHRGEVDLVAGGPPCQPFSRAGKREMVGCEKGQLFMDFVRIVDGVRPRWFLFENVKGLILHGADVAKGKCDRCSSVQLLPFGSRDEFRDSDTADLYCQTCDQSRQHTVFWRNKRAGSLDIIRAEFERLGYKCYDNTLNAADFGAPQSRERIFIVGSRDEENFEWPMATHIDPAKIGANMPTLFDRGHMRKAWKTTREAIFSEGHWRYGELDPNEAVLWVKNVVRPHDEPVTWTLDRIAPTIGAHQSAKLAVAPRGVPEAQLARQQWHVLGRRQGDTPPVFVEHEYLTDPELLALQTFPRSWYLHGTRMERAFQIGNAVPPVLAQAVAEAIIAASRLSDQQKGGQLAHASRI